MSGSPTHHGARRTSLSDESGAVAIVAVLLIVVLLGAVGFVIDLGRLRHERGTLQNAMDLGSLAGAGLMPVRGSSQGAAAESLALTVARANSPAINGGLPVTASYRCVVADPEGNGGGDSPEIGFTCGPSSGTWSSGWTNRGARTIHDCDPYAGDLCNTLVLQTVETLDFFFAPAMGIRQGSTGSVRAASCKGACGTASAPLDVVMVLDRTGSMSPSDIVNLKDGAKAVLDAYDARDVFVGMVALPYGRQPAFSSNMCVVNNPQLYTPPSTTASNWWNVRVQGGYDNPDGSLNTASPIGAGINCLQRSPTVTVRVNGVDRTSAGHTNLGDPLDSARAMLNTYGRAGVQDVIIFETDGQANQPAGWQPCNYLNTKASTAKANGDLIYTIAYGLDNPPVRCTDTSGPFVNRYATTNLAAAATTSIDDVPGGCGANENRDGDYYFCAPAGADLTPVFTTVAGATLRNTRLLDL